MPRSLFEPLYQRLREAHPPSRAYSRGDWDQQRMPRPVERFLQHLLRHQSRREARRLRRARTDWVNYDHPEMEAAVRTFFEAAEAHVQVPSDEWEERLRQAVTRTTQYLVRPVPVLVDFVFEDRDEALSVDRIQWRMQFFEAYGYLRQAVHAYAEKRDVESLSPGRFESVLNRVDQQIPADFSKDRWLEVLGPLFGMAKSAFDREQLPVPLLQTFFEEKNQTGVVQALGDYAEEGNDEIGPPALGRLLEDELGPTSAAREPTHDAPPAPSTSTSSPDDTARRPLWKRFQRGRSSPERSASDPPDTGGEPLWTQFRHGQDSRASRIGGAGRETESSTRTEAEDHGDAAGPDRSSSIDGGDDTDALEALEREVLGTARPAHRGVYVKELFEGDQDAYAKVLRRLRRADTWNEASNIIAEDIFRTHGVNIYSDPAVHFTDAAEARFRE